MRTLEVRNELDQLVGYHEVVSLNVDNVSIQADTTVTLPHYKIIEDGNQKLLVAREAERVSSRVAKNIAGLQDFIAHNIGLSQRREGPGITIISDGVPTKGSQYWINIHFFIQARPNHYMRSHLSGVYIMERLIDIRRVAVSHGA